MLTLEGIKLFLRVDGNEEDDLLKSLEKFSIEEIENSTGVKYVESGLSETYMMAQRIIITDMYEQRSSLEQGIIPNNFLSSLYLKLKLKV